MMDHEELLQKTREKAFVTLVRLCEDNTASPEVRLQSATVLIQATDQDLWRIQVAQADEETEKEASEGGDAP